MTSAYATGFVEKCAEYGVDRNTTGYLLKTAWSLFGGKKPRTFDDVMSESGWKKDNTGRWYSPVNPNTGEKWTPEEYHTAVDRKISGEKEKYRRELAGDPVAKTLYNGAVAAVRPRPTTAGTGATHEIVHQGRTPAPPVTPAASPAAKKTTMAPRQEIKVTVRRKPKPDQAATTAGTGVVGSGNGASISRTSPTGRGSIYMGAARTPTTTKGAPVASISRTSPTGRGSIYMGAERKKPGV